MQAQYLQNVRYKLQKRIRRLNGADSDNFFYLLKQFWVFFDGYPILQAVTEELRAKVPDYSATVDKIFGGQHLVGTTEEESAAIGYEVLRRFAAQTQPLHFYKLVPGMPGNVAEMLEQFKTSYLEPFYEYLDEHLDDRNFVLLALIRYKHRCEWFERERLYRLWEENRQRGEHLLAYDLYEYLFEQGIEFQIEPASASGEADMVSSQVSSEPLIADAKVFNPDSGKSKSYIKQAFHQIYRYTCDYNQSIGYLIIFNASQKQLRFALQSTAEPIPRILFNHKTIFFLEIDIFPHSEPASRRKPPEAIEITEQEIVGGETVS